MKQALTALALCCAVLGNGLRAGASRPVAWNGRPAPAGTCRNRRAGREMPWAASASQNIFEVKPEASADPNYAEPDQWRALLDAARQQRADVAPGGGQGVDRLQQPARKARRPRPAT